MEDPAVRVMTADACWRRTASDLTASRCMRARVPRHWTAHLAGWPAVAYCSRGVVAHSVTPRSGRPRMAMHEEVRHDMPYRLSRTISSCLPAVGRHWAGTPSERCAGPIACAFSGRWISCGHLASDSRYQEPNECCLRKTRRRTCVGTGLTVPRDLSAASSVPVRSFLEARLRRADRTGPYGALQRSARAAETATARSRRAQAWSSRKAE